MFGTWLKRNRSTREVVTETEMAPLTKTIVTQGLLLATVTALLTGCVPVNLPAPTITQSPVSTAVLQMTDSPASVVSHVSSPVPTGRILYYSNVGGDRSHIYVTDSDGANANEAN